jgi:hypothetical protein
MRYRRTAIDIGILLALVCLVGWPLLTGSVLAGHDVITHLTYSQQTAANLREGHLLPAWAGHLNAGCGSPGLLFYPPFTLIIHAMPMLLGAGAVAVIGPLALLALLLSGLAFRSCCRQLAGPAAATAAAAVYMVAPYRVITLFKRTALAEHWSFLWFPLIIWAITRSQLPARRRLVLTAVPVAGLVLTNLPIAVLFLTGLGLWYVIQAWVCSPPENLPGLRSSMAWGVAAGLGLSCFMLLPQALARQWVRMDQYGGDTGVFRPSANTLFNSSALDPAFNTSVSLVVLLTCALALTAYLLLRPQVRKQRHITLVVLGAVTCVAFTLPPLGSLLDVVPIYSNLQFPWRITSLLTMLAGVLVCYLPPKRAWLVVGLAVLAAIPFSGYRSGVLPGEAFNSEPPQAELAGRRFADPAGVAEAGGSSGPWRHRQLADVLFTPSATRDLLFAELAGTPQRQLDLIRQRPAVVLEAPATPIEVIEWRSTRRTIRVTCQNRCTVLWRSQVFPGLEVTCSDRLLPTYPDPDTGLLAHRLARGSHVLTWQWRPFPVLRIGRLVSLATLLLLLGCWFRSWRRFHATIGL